MAKSIPLVVFFSWNPVRAQRTPDRPQPAFPVLMMQPTSGGSERQRFNSRKITPATVMKLPATVKHLLNLRDPSPPTAPRLSGILKSTLVDAKRKNAETAWLVLAVRHGGILGLHGRSSKQ